MDDLADVPLDRPDDPNWGWSEGEKGTLVRTMSAHVAMRLARAQFWSSRTCLVASTMRCSMLSRREWSSAMSGRRCRGSSSLAARRPLDAGERRE